MLRRAAPTALLLLAAPLGAHAQDDDPRWSCTNPDLEIACDAGACRVSQDHTPMDVTLGRGVFEVCAYSVCWSGEGISFININGTVMAATRETRRIGDQSGGDGDSGGGPRFQLMFETETGLGALVGGGWTNPLRCTPVG